MFKFGFSSDDQNDEENKKEEKTSILWKECKEIDLNNIECIEKSIEDCDLNEINVENVNIKLISSTDIILKLIKNTEDDDESDSILKAEENHSDLLTGVYEGGLKVWECTHDVIEYMKKEKLDLEGKKILDLGCGVGVIGILCMMNKAVSYFQDYNEEVIKHVTIPNVVINKENPIEKCKFFSGDWSSFAEKLQNDKFDYIFTSETIYNSENYEKLHKVFENLLKKDGIIYLAAKSYYFGVGGGLSEFKDFITCKNIFNYECVWKQSKGLEREILKIKFN